MYDLPVFINDENKHIVIVDRKKLQNAFQPLTVIEQIVLKGGVAVGKIVFDINGCGVCNI